MLLSVGSNRARILVLDLQTQKRNSTTQYSEEQVIEITFQIENECTALVFTSDNLQLAAGNNNGKVWIFDIYTREQLFNLDIETNETIQQMIFFGSIC